ncbi:MAG: efflux RND transporter periplasmic adaptor subunit [Saprospiraceae bacterium]
MKKYLLYFSPLFFLFACGNGKEEASSISPENKAIPVRTVKVSNETLVQTIHASGIVTSENDAKPAFKTGGVISKILVEEGDFVKQGQLLATLNLTEINAQVQQSGEAVQKAQRDLQRAKNLYADSVATLEQVQNAQTALTVAGETQKMAKFNQSYSEIRSPISGKVIQKLMVAGEIAGPGMPVFYILGNSSKDWVIKAGLADRDWARLKRGDKAEVHFDAFPGQTYPATITRLADVGNPASGTFDAELTLRSNPPKMVAGLIASVEFFPENKGNLPVIPLDALVESDRNHAKVYTIENQKARAVPITIAFLHQDKVAVSKGLENIQMVVTDGAPYLFDGALVKIVQ